VRSFSPLPGPSSTTVEMAGRRLKMLVAWALSRDCSVFAMRYQGRRQIASNSDEPRSSYR
jgi:hypothetical protein